MSSRFQALDGSRSVLGHWEAKVGLKIALRAPLNAALPVLRGGIGHE